MIDKDGAQVYSAPKAHCYVVGKKLRPGARLVAYLEYKAFTLAGAPGGKDEGATWVWSNQLKDATPAKDTTP